MSLFMLRRTTGLPSCWSDTNSGLLLGCGDHKSEKAEIFENSHKMYLGYTKVL